MKDQIIEVIDGMEPVDALQALFAAVHVVAAANGVGRFTLSEMFSSTMDAYFEVSDAAEDEAEQDEQTDD